LKDTERRLRLATVQVRQQERIVADLEPGPGRIEALSRFAELLREQYEAELAVSATMSAALSEDSPDD
jgi:hypothetical protein